MVEARRFFCVFQRRISKSCVCCIQRLLRRKRRVRLKEKDRL